MKKFPLISWGLQRKKDVNQSKRVPPSFQPNKTQHKWNQQAAIEISESTGSCNETGPSYRPWQKHCRWYAGNAWARACEAVLPWRGI